MPDPCPPVDGLLLLDKPEGPTSHDMVDEVRRLLGGARVGHTGTLDPMATGLLVVLVGRATRLAPYVRGDPKVYTGRVVLGMETDTMDLHGAVLERKGFGGGEEEVERAMSALEGDLEQVPPAFSAVKYRGRPAYRYARRGEKVELPGRTVKIYRMEMTAFRRRGEVAEADFVVECSPGTYVRELASRMGRALSCGGTLARLRRVASGPFRVEEARSPEEVARLSAAGEPFLLPAHRALEGMRCVEVTDTWREAVANGSPVHEKMLASRGAELAPGDAVAVMARGALLAVHEVLESRPFRSRPLRVLSGG